MPTWTKEVVDLSVAGSSLTIDDIKIDGTTIGHTDDTDLLTLANGALTVAGTLTSSDDIILSNTKKLRLDGSASGDTYIMQNGADVIDIVVGGDTMMKFTEASNETIDISAEYVNFTGANTTYIPKLNLKNAADTSSPSVLQFSKTTRGTGAVQDGDLIGRIISSALNDNNTSISFANIQTYITDASNGTEKGKIRFNVANGTDGGLDTVLTLEGTTTDFKPACQVEGYFSANGQTPAAAPDWTVSNKSGTSRSLDANGNIAAIGDNLAQLVDDLIAIGILQ